MEKRLESQLKTKSRIYKRHNSGWVEIFCPFCGDAVRRSNPSHGHLYFNPEIGCFRCFRCDTSGSLIKVLNEYGISDPQLLTWLASKSSKTYLLGKKQITKHSNTINDRNLKSLEMNVDLEPFYQYIEQRFGVLDPIKYNIRPYINGGRCVGISFYNASDKLVTTRFFEGSIRYNNPNIRYWYYFQPLKFISEYDNILITEGSIDAINSIRYTSYFRGCFAIAINGNNYSGDVEKLINHYLKIGKYTIHVILDNGLKFERRIIYNLNKCMEYNPDISIKIYKPLNSKDISELMVIGEVSCPNP